jgi:hypothetical protein
MYHLILLFVDVIYILSRDYSDCGRGFGFIGLLDTARDYILQFIITRTLVYTVTWSLPLLGSGFQ